MQSFDLRDRAGKTARLNPPSSPPPPIHITMTIATTTRPSSPPKIPEQIGMSSRPVGRSVAASSRNRATIKPKMSEKSIFKNFLINNKVGFGRVAIDFLSVSGSTGTP